MPTSTSHLDTISIPQSLKQAKNSPQWPQWEQAMLAELNSLISNQTWEEVPKRSLPEGSKLVGSRWVFDLKYNADGAVERYNA